MPKLWRKLRDAGVIRVLALLTMADMGGHEIAEAPVGPEEAPPFEPETVAPVEPEPTPAPTQQPKAAKKRERRAPSPTPQPSRVGKGEMSAQEMRTLGCVRMIRAEAQNLQKLLDGLKEKAELTDKTEREVALEGYVKSKGGLVKKSGEKLAELVELFDQYVSTYPEISDWCGDVKVQVEDAWDAANSKVPVGSVSPDDISPAVTAVDESLSEIIRRCGKLSIPPRVDQHLKTVRVGQTLDFHKRFSDELDKEADRLEVLEYLEAHPGALKQGGITDAKNGVIWRASPNLWRQVLSYFLIGWFLLGGALIVALLGVLGSGLNLQGWPVTNARLPELLSAYLFLVVGAFAHVGIGILKQARQAKPSTLTALGSVFIWIHVKETAIIVGVITLWIGIIGLAFLTQSVQWALAFFVGYSIDSFVDLFIGKFETQVSTGVEEAKKTLGLGGEESKTTS